MMERTYRMLGPIALACAWPSASLLGQSPIALQPMQLVQGPSSPQPPSALPDLKPNQPITLESIPKEEIPKQPSADQKHQALSVLPMTPAAQSTKTAKKANLNVDDMIRKPVTSADVLSRVKTYQSLDNGAPLAPTSRNELSGGYCWESPAFCHSPLYFEQPNLERYGIGKGPLLTPAWSATYFYGQVLAWPFTTIHQPPWTKQCTLGNHRPGDCAPLQGRQYRNSFEKPAVATGYHANSTYVVSEQEFVTQEIGSGTLLPNTQNSAPILYNKTPSIDNKSPVPENAPVPDKAPVLDPPASNVSTQDSTLLPPVYVTRQGSSR